MRGVARGLARPRAVWGRGAILLVRTAGAALVVALPLIVLPWGIDAYSFIKGLLTYALTLTILLGWIVAWGVLRGPRWRSTGPELALWIYVLALLGGARGRQRRWASSLRS